MKIREDIFPEVEGHVAQRIVQGLTHLTFEAFGALFSSADDVIKYINDFEDPKIALRFLEIGEFYHFAKFYYCPNCFHAKRLESCPLCKKLRNACVHGLNHDNFNDGTIDGY